MTWSQSLTFDIDERFSLWRCNTNDIVILHCSCSGWIIVQQQCWARHISMKLHSLTRCSGKSIMHACTHRFGIYIWCNVHKYVYRWRYIHLEDLISTYQHHCRILISTHTYLHPVYIHQPADRAQLHTTTDLEHMMIRLVFTTRTASSSMPTRQYNDMPHDYLVNNPNSSTNSNSGRRMQWYSYSCYPRTIYAGHIPQPQLIFRNREGTYHGGFVVSEDNFGYARYYYCGNPYFFAAVSEHSIVDDHRAGPIRQNSNNYINGQRTQTRMQMQPKHRPLDRTPPPPPLPIIGTTLE